MIKYFIYQLIRKIKFHNMILWKIIYRDELHTPLNILPQKYIRELDYSPILYKSVIHALYLQPTFSIQIEF